jgi:hypothetical protein
MPTANTSLQLKMMLVLCDYPFTAMIFIPSIFQKMEDNYVYVLCSITGVTM